MDVQGVDVALYLLRVFVFLFDMITFPIYKLLQQPWKERTKQNHGKVYLLFILFKFKDSIFIKLFVVAIVNKFRKSIQFRL